METLTTDTDIVLAQDGNGKIIFMKTFDKSEREEMLKAYDYVSTIPNACYRMCGIERIKIPID